MASVPLDRAELEQRLAQATPRDTVRGMFLRGALSVVREAGGPEASLACLRQAGLGRIVDPLSYEVGQYLRLAWAAASALEPQAGSPGEALRQLGAGAFAVLRDSPLGRAALALADEPRRLLANTPVLFQASVSFGTRSVRWLGPAEAELVYRRDFLPPAFHQGLLEAGLAAAGAQQVQVTGRADGLLDATYHLTWR